MCPTCRRAGCRLQTPPGHAITDAVVRTHRQNAPPESVKAAAEKLFAQWGQKRAHKKGPQTAGTPRAPTPTSGGAASSSDDDTAGRRMMHVEDSNMMNRQVMAAVAKRQAAAGPASGGKATGGWA